LLILLVYAPWALNSEPFWCFWILLGIAGICSLSALVGLPPEPADHEAYQLTPPLKLLRILAVAFLTYVFVSAVNARAKAVVGWGGVGLEYLECISWLPHSYDRSATWMAWIEQLAVAGIFWATWKWMAMQTAQRAIARRSGSWPGGFKRMMWVVSASTSVMAVEAIFQRLSKTDYLLFFYPRITWSGVLSGKEALGPFAYQGSGCAYFNLIWPLVLGFWWVIRQREWERTGVRPRFGASKESILPVGVALMVACPLITTSRTGVAVCLLQIAALSGYSVLQWRRLPQHLRWSLTIGLVILGGFVFFVGIGPLMKKVGHTHEDKWGERLLIYEQTHRMIPDFDPWGGGAASFRALSNLYTDPNKPSWESFVHDEWLEARFSYGWIGYTAIWLMLGSWLLALRWTSLRSLPSGFSPFLAVSIAGFLLDARFDIPLQTMSLHILLALVCAIALYSGSADNHHTGVGMRR
jgi:hypothetical protein